MFDLLFNWLSDVASVCVIARLIAWWYDCLLEPVDIFVMRVVCLIHCLVGCLLDQLMDRFFDCLIRCLIGWSND